MRDPFYIRRFGVKSGGFLWHVEARNNSKNVEASSQSGDLKLAIKMIADHLK